MELFDAIHTRRSIRKYTDEPVSDEDLHKILSAAMVAPTAKNMQSWRFVVVKDRKLLQALGNISPSTHMAAQAPLAIVVCSDTKAAASPDGFWLIDGVAAIENMLLAITALGLGAVWCAGYPMPDRINGYTEICHLPEHIKPVGLVVIGHPAVEAKREDRFDPAKVKYNTWD